MLVGQFHLPIIFDLVATFLLAVTGALAAERKGYDVMGVMVLALATGAGGSLIRDSIFLRQGPPAVLVDGRYLLVIVAAGLVGLFFGARLNRVEWFFTLADALGLGIYMVVGAQKTINAGLPVTAALLVGVTNAVGGGVIRDVLAREEPILFKPGYLYALAAVIGCAVFLGLGVGLRMDAQPAALIAIGLTFLLRVLSLRLNITTHRLIPRPQRQARVLDDPASVKPARRKVAR